ncbi:MAG: MliC family protein, partial [Pseudomonadota bacterium]
NFRRSLQGNNNGGNTPAVNVVRYRCGGGRSMVVEFRNTGRGSATYSLSGGPRINLPALRTGSGMRYGDGFRELSGKGNRLTLRESGRRIARCRS